MTSALEYRKLLKNCNCPRQIEPSLFTTSATFAHPNLSTVAEPGAYSPSTYAHEGTPTGGDCWRCTGYRSEGQTRKRSGADRSAHGGRLPTAESPCANKWRLAAAAPWNPACGRNPPSAAGRPKTRSRGGPLPLLLTLRQVPRGFRPPRPLVRGAEKSERANWRDE